MKHSSILLLAAIIASGCPSKSNDHDDAGSTHDASTDADASSTTDAGTCTPTSATDEPDNASVDANCDGIDGDVSDAVFVALAPVGDDAHDGSRASPVATLGRALQLATTGDKSQVLVAEGTYLGAITIVAGVSIYGDYRPSESWSRPQGAVTTIQSDGTVVIADDIDVATRISRIDIRANDALAASPSSIAVIVRGSSSFSIEDGEVRAGRGFDGASGQTPAQPAQGPSGGNGRDPYIEPSCDNDQPAGPVALGSGGSSPYCDRGGNGGIFNGVTTTAPTLGKIAGSNVGMSCLNTGIDHGTVGAVGSVGAAGSGGPPAAAIGTFSSTGYALASGTNGQGGSLGGGGGGGPTGGGTFFNDCTTSGDNPVCYVGPPGGGGGGAGGLPGLGGIAGQGGGASIGVLAWQSTIRLVRVTIVADDGGDAGDGAAGGTGGIGGMGGAGGAGVAPCALGVCCSAAWAIPGIAGGNGGNGGNGGGGSGGTGGPSIGIVLGGGANVDSASPPVISTGSGGAGGAGGAPTNGGSTGPVHTILTVP